MRRRALLGLFAGAALLTGVATGEAATLPKLSAETGLAETVQYYGDGPRTCWIDRYGSRVCGRPWQRGREYGGGYGRDRDRVCWQDRYGSRVCGTSDQYRAARRGGGERVCWLNRYGERVCGVR